MHIKPPKARNKYIRPNVNLTEMLDLESLQEYMSLAPRTARYPNLPDVPEAALLYLTSALAIEVRELLSTLEELDYGDEQLDNGIVVAEDRSTQEEIGDVLWYGVLLLNYIGLDHTTPKEDLGRCLGSLEYTSCAISMSEATLLTALPAAAANLQEMAVKAYRDMHRLEDRAEYTEKLNDEIRRGVIVILAWCALLADISEVELSGICEENIAKLKERTA